MIKRILLTLIALVCLLSLYGQKIEQYDQVIDMQYYVACYSKKIETSSFVIYKLYKGGGSYSRAGMAFTAYNSLPHFNYYKSGYDKGHLVPAKDFSHTKDELSSTFYYVNCIPQHAGLNRGMWKTVEESVRRLSQEDSVLVICGGCDYDLSDVHIPRNCFKVVYRLSDGRCILSLLFSNDSMHTSTENDKIRRKMTFTKMRRIYVRAHHH